MHIVVNMHFLTELENVHIFSYIQAIFLYAVHGRE